jgi:hypothetical protein
MMMRMLIAAGLLVLVWSSSTAEELPPLDGTVTTQILLDQKAHNAMVKASYQSNVKTIYFHLEEIIKKILAHKQKWTSKYNGDLGKIAKEVNKHRTKEKAAMKKYISAKGKASGAKKLSDLKNKSWQKAKNKLKQKINDAKKAKKALKGLYVKGLKQKAGEICMIRKIQCMVAKFNGEAKLQKKYCGVCTDDKKAKMIEKWVTASGKAATKPANVQMLGAVGRLVKNKRTNTVTVPTDFSLEFSITLKGRVGNWGSVFHFTKGGNCCNHGQRIPAMWFKPNSNTFIVVDGTNKNGNAYGNCGTVPFNKKTQIKMRFGRKTATVWVNGKTGCTLKRDDRQVWKDVQFWNADPWYPAANAVVTRTKMTTF